MLRALVHVGSVPILEAIPKASKATNSTADSHCLDFPSNKTMVVKGSNTSIELQLGAYYGDPICLSTQTSTCRTEAPMVRVDYEWLVSPPPTGSALALVRTLRGRGLGRSGPRG